MDQNKCTIYCCYHNQSQLLDDGNTWFYGPSDPLNQFLSEFSMFKYIWENDTESAYIGTCHYRRRIINTEFDPKKCTNDSCQALEIISGTSKCKYSNLGKWTSNEFFQCEFLHNDYMYYLKNICNKKISQRLLDLETSEIPKGIMPRFVSKSSFIMRREEFMELCDYLFGYVEYVDEKYQLNHDIQNYMRFVYIYWFRNHTTRFLPYNMHIHINIIKRILAYILEMMCSLYIRAKFTYIHLLSKSYNEAKVMYWQAELCDFQQSLPCINKTE